MAERLLLDTTYFLPLFGIDVRLAGFENRFPKILDEYEVCYNPVSLLEAKWISLRLGRGASRNKFLEAYRSGLATILADKRISQTKLTNATVELAADQLLAVDGVRDYFDRMIYATAAAEETYLLTEDKELLLLGKGERESAPRGIFSWKGLQ